MAEPTIYINDSHPRKDGNCSFYLKLFINGKYLNIPLSLSDKPENFNKETFQISGKGSKEKNLLINRALGQASDILLKYQVHNKTLTKDLFIAEFSNPAIFTDFYAFMESQIKNRQGEITDSSIKAQISILNNLKTYRKDLLLAEINEDFLKEYQKYLLKKLKMKPASSNNQFKTIKVYVSKARRMKLIDTDPFQYFKMKQVNQIPEFLTVDERDALIELYQSNKLLDNYKNVLRWFLFSCFTGLRISDLRLVKHEQIINGILSFHPFKTLNVNNNKVYIPLSKTALKLIADESTRKTGFLFSCISEPRMNLYIKEVCKVIKLSRKISFHAARHTFATIFLQKSKNANGIIILQKLLGHKKLESTLKYSHVLDSDIKNAIQEFD